MNGSVFPMIPGLGKQKKKKMTVRSYFTICCLVGTTDTQMYVHKH